VAGSSIAERDELWYDGSIWAIEALQALRERMVVVNQELHVLIIAVGKLKKRLRVE